MKYISETYSNVNLEDYSVDVNFTVTDLVRKHDWVLLWDRGKIVESGGKEISKKWMESFRFEGNKIDYINMFSK